MLFPNLPIRTQGGWFFWTIIDSKKGWKLQQHVLTNHYRILDKENVRQAWSLDEHEIRRAFRKYTED